jgi:CheY-like chemotaxis protein
MDMMMSGMNGLEATRRIRELPSGEAVPIFVLTASVFEEDRHLVLAAGANEFVRKPFQADEVFILLERHLGAKYLYRDRVRSSMSDGAPSSLSLRGLDLVPSELRRVLRAAAEAADQEQVLLACDRIESTSPQISEKIRRMAAEFQYEGLLAVLSEEGCG